MVRHYNPEVSSTNTINDLRVTYNNNIDLYTLPVFTLDYTQWPTTSVDNSYNTGIGDEFGNLTNVDWPVKPEPADEQLQQEFFSYPNLY